MAWSLTDVDRSDLRAQFLALDKDKDGTITVEKFWRVLQKNFAIERDEAEAIFNSMDVRKTKRVAYSEFLAAAMHSSFDLGEDAVRSTFQRFDTDRAGNI